jgi:hypothetical protein
LKLTQKLKIFLDTNSIRRKRFPIVRFIDSLQKKELPYRAWANSRHQCLSPNGERAIRKCVGYGEEEIVNTFISENKTPKFILGM